jgi:hypothetical protein
LRVDQRLGGAYHRSEPGDESINVHGHLSLLLWL